jgi:hypothetical protein
MMNSTDFMSTAKSQGLNPDTLPCTVKPSVRQSAFGAGASQPGDDVLIEYLIDNAYRRLMAASGVLQQRRWCDRLKHWIEQRIARVEQ